MVCSSIRGQGWGVGGRGLQTRGGLESGFSGARVESEKGGYIVRGRWEVRRDVRGDWRRQCFSVLWLGKRGVVEV